MGCKQSKLGGRIQPVGPASVKKDNTKRTRGEFDIEYKTGKKIRKTKSQNSKLFGSSVSLDDDRSLADSERGFSASSKFSKKSGDSGLEADYGFIITEDSDPDKVRKIEEEFNQNENLGKIFSYFRHRFCIINIISEIFKFLSLSRHKVLLNVGIIGTRFVDPSPFFKIF